MISNIHPVASLAAGLFPHDQASRDKLAEFALNYQRAGGVPSDIVPAFLDYGLRRGRGRP